MEIDFLNELNDSQREAVLYNDGPSLVIAGAGSGKTRVLTYKIAYLIKNEHIAPERILALTFTNKAAKEMKERIADLIGRDVSVGLWMGTFHSIFSRILRKEAATIGFSPYFTIYDQADSRNLVKTIIKEMAEEYNKEKVVLDENKYKPVTIACQISNAKNRLITPEMYAASRDIRLADERNDIPLTAEIYRRYAARCRQADAMDFDDLLLYTYILFDRNPNICRRYEERFDFVLVDEYQDTNYAQHCIVWMLTHTKQRVCVVGDDAQSIYSFRGANIENILNFADLYNNTHIFKLEQNCVSTQNIVNASNSLISKNTRTFKLEQNYRSTQTIVNAANSLIKHNNEQIQKKVFSKNKIGEPIVVFAAYSDLEEANIVINKMTELHRKKDLAYDDFAILYRTNAQSRAFEEALLRHNIPYRIYGGQSFYQRKEIKDVLAYCRLVVNPNDEEAFKRVVNYPKRGIGQTTVDKVTDTASENNVSLWEVSLHPEQYGLVLNKGTMAKLSSFTGFIESLVEEQERLDAASLMVRVVRESGIMNDIFQDQTPEGMSRQENIQELLGSVQSFVETRQEEGEEQAMFLSDFLQEVSLLSDLDEDGGDDLHKVTLMTIHSAKGLEFRTVFVVGMEENLFPSPMAGNSPRALEEERRLFYVAMTRAEEYCFLSFARSRYRYGKTEFSNPSRFLQEVDKTYLKMNHGALSGRTTGQSWSSRQEMPFEASSRRPRSAYDMEGSGMPVRATARVVGLKPLAATGTKGKAAESTVSPPVHASSPVQGASSSAVLQAGQTIEHERFGIGKVEKVEGSGENAKATVKFQNTGTKQLLLRFARFKILG